MSTLKEILNATRQLIDVKTAEFNSTLEGGEKQAKGLDTSGAGDDSPKTRGHALEADQAALEPQKKPLDSADANAEPPSDGKGTTGGAEGKEEGNQTDRTDKLEAEDPAPANLTKKPAVTADADAKVAEGEDGSAKLANEILDDIHNWQASQKKADDDAPAAEKPEGEKADDDAPAAEKPEDEKGAEAKKADDAPAAKKVDDAPAPTADKPEGEKVEGDGKEASAEKNLDKQSAEKSDDGKQAAGPQLELTTDVLAKIAALILSTEEGADVVEQALAKQAGAESAEEVMAFLTDQSERAEKQAAYESGAADAEAMIQQAIFDSGVAEGQKQAGTQKQAEKPAAKPEDQKPVNIYEKLGQMAADASIGDLMGAAGGMGGEMGGAMGGEPAVAPEELAGGGGGMEAGMEAGREGEEGGITEEELQEALNALVQEGQISPEEAQGVLDYIASAGEAGEAGEAAAAPAEEEVPPPPEEGAAPVGGEEGMEAVAEDKSKKQQQPVEKAAALLDAIRAIRQQRKAV